MAQKKKFRIDLTILIPIIILAIISVFTIKSAETILPGNPNYMNRQIVWYVIGLVIVITMMLIKNNTIFKFTWFLYWLFVLLLFLLLIFGHDINNAKRWFVIPRIGAFQPSEFMKIILIPVIGLMISSFRDKYNAPTVGQEFMFLLKVLIIVFIPSILTLLQPDTGSIAIYMLITIVMLFIAGIRYRWFILVFALIAAFIAILLSIYFINIDLFIKLFGTDFFLRVDRLLDWSNSSGFQLENSLVAIGSGGPFGVGHNMTPIYFPEPQTDFIFSVFSSNFGFFGSLGLIALLLYLDLRLIILAINCNKPINKYIISGIVAMLVYQQVQNIGMTFGLMPITGITLPFVSYGGSSLMSYMIILGIIFNISNEETKTGLV